MVFHSFVVCLGLIRFLLSSYKIGQSACNLSLPVQQALVLYLLLSHQTNLLRKNTRLTEPFKYRTEKRARLGGQYFLCQEMLCNTASKLAAANLRQTICHLLVRYMTKKKQGLLNQVRDQEQNQIHSLLFNIPSIVLRI